MGTINNKGKWRTYLAVVVAAIVVGLMVPGRANAANCGAGVAICVCGDTVVANTTLVADLTCAAGSGLIIGANNRVVDLNGFTLTGT